MFFWCWKMTLKVQILQSLRRLFIILVGLTMIWFSKKCLFLIYAYVVWCPTWSKNLGRSLFYSQPQGFQTSESKTQGWGGNREPKSRTSILRRGKRGSNVISVPLHQCNAARWWWFRTLLVLLIIWFISNIAFTILYFRCALYTLLTKVLPLIDST